MQLELLNHNHTSESTEEHEIENSQIHDVGIANHFTTIINEIHGLGAFRFHFTVLKNNLHKYRNEIAISTVIRLRAIFFRSVCVCVGIMIIEGRHDFNYHFLIKVRLFDQHPFEIL